MNEQPNYFKIGLFVIAGVVLVGGALVIFGARAFFREGVVLETYLQESAHGLIAGSPVYYRGVKVGQVEEVTLTSREYPLDVSTQPGKCYPLVKFEVYPAEFGKIRPQKLTELIAHWVEMGLRVERVPQGLTGTSYLEMAFKENPPDSGITFDWKPKWPHVPSVPGVMARVTDTIAAAKTAFDALERAELDEVAKSVNRLATTTRTSLQDARLGDLSADARELMQELSGTSEALSRLLEDPRIDETLEGTSGAATSLDEITTGAKPEIEQTLDDLKAAARRLNDSTQSLPESMADLNRLLRQLNDMLSRHRQGVSQAIRDLERSSRNLKDLTERARQYPSGFLFGEPPPPVEPQQ